MTRVEQRYNQIFDSICTTLQDLNLYMRKGISVGGHVAFNTTIDALKLAYQDLEAYRLLNAIRAEELYVVDLEGHIVPISFA